MTRHTGVSPAFEQSFSRFEDAKVRCNCGVTHFATGEGSEILKDHTRVEAVRLLRKLQPVLFFEDPTAVCIVGFSIFGKMMVCGCVCNSLESLEAGLMEDHDRVQDFYAAVERDRAKRRLENLQRIR